MNHSLDISTTHDRAMSERKNLISPFWDFIFLGGGWLLLLPFFAMIPSSLQHGSLHELITKTAFWIQPILHFPHFFFSYYLLYSNFGERLKIPKQSVLNQARLWVAGVVVPFVLLTYLMAAYFLPSQTMIGIAAQVMLFTLGWHHTKQGYGVLVIMSQKKGIHFSRFEANILRGNVYVGWLSAWIYLQSLPGLKKIFGVHSVLPVSGEIGFLALLFSGLCGLAAIIILLRKSWQEKQPPSWTGIAGYVAPLYTWLVLAGIHPLLPILSHGFHALQYLPFAMRLTYNKNNTLVKHKTHLMLRFWGLLLGIVLAGWLVLDAIPGIFDRAELATLTQAQDIEAIGAFLPLAFVIAIFVNIHHYFIDAAIWRRDNPELKQYL